MKFGNVVIGQIQKVGAMPKTYLTVVNVFVMSTLNIWKPTAQNFAVYVEKQQRTRNAVMGQTQTTGAMMIIHLIAVNVLPMNIWNISIPIAQECVAYVVLMSQIQMNGVLRI